MLIHCVCWLFFKDKINISQLTGHLSMIFNTLRTHYIMRSGIFPSYCIFVSTTSLYYFVCLLVLWIQADEDVFHFEHTMGENITLSQPSLAEFKS